MISDKQRFMRILDEHQGILINLCSIYYDNPKDQQDAFQDVAIQLWKSFKSFKGDSKLSTWIYKVALNTLLNKKRREKRRALEITSLDQAATLPLREDQGVDDDCQLLMKLISGLGDKDKAILILHLEGYSNKEIASSLSMSQSNVSTRMNRAKNTLKGKLEDNKKWRLRI
ncbi:RNA polymerase sigma factor [Roseivirga sp.]|uniref:RNA polymerase sigma factor n=1 Tax=Roseivirga sp. TaxID=1964215 RepID=UPI003B8BD2A2